MDRRRLRSFIALAEELHFGRAAARSNITQPALSQQLLQLEGELQVELVQRTRRHVGLTRAGEAFLVEARKIVASMDHAVHLTREVERGLSGQIVVGATATAIYIALPAMIRRYKAVMPGIQVLVRECSTTVQEAALRSGEIDVSICHPPVEDVRLTCLPIGQIPFDIVMSDANPLATKKRLYLRDLADESFIVFARSIAPNMYDNVIAKCREAGFSLKVILESAPAQSIVGLAACGVGIGLIASRVQHFPHPMAVFRRLTGIAPTLSLGVAYSGNTPPIAVQTFVDVAVAVGHQLK